MTAVAIERSAPPPWLFAGALALAFVLVLFIFRDGLVEMERVWGEPEYSYAYLIPFLALYVLAARLPALREVPLRESGLGLVLLVVGLLAFVFGELSSLYIIVQYGFILAIWGLILVAIGPRGVTVIWAALLFLVFLVPLPRFVQFGLSSQLQLVSSELGTLMLRGMGVPVFLEGNVIDLGVYKLQVVEACSGLRYLFPLMSFGFLCAVMFRGPVWQRWLIFLSSLPITVLMNSFRIAVTGVLVNQFGIESAEGFLHYFEGWVIFGACLVLMFGEMALLAKLSGQKLDDALDLYVPTGSEFRGWFSGRVPGTAMRAAAGLLLVAAVLSVVITGREELIPAHQSLARFPLAIGDWRGREESLTQAELDTLRLTDYTVVNYQNPAVAGAVQLYIAYYDSQRKGTSAHSPRSCLPGSGWRFEEFAQRSVPGVQADGTGVPVNRALISMGKQRLLVYYWFMQRGRLVTNEYLVKWYIFWDSLTRRRTDGALVRLVAPVPESGAVAATDEQLADFMRAAYPALYYHLPQAEAVPAVASPLAAR